MGSARPLMPRVGMAQSVRHTFTRSPHAGVQPAHGRHVLLVRGSATGEEARRMTQERFPATPSMDRPSTELDRGPARPRWWPSLVLFAGGWLAVATVHYFQIWIFSWLGLFGFAVLLGAWLVAAGLTTRGALRLWRRAGWRGLVPFLAAATAIAVLVVMTDWRRFYATSWHNLHRADFAAVARLVEDRGWISTAQRVRDQVHLDDNLQLPEQYQYLSNTRSLTLISSDHKVALLDQWAPGNHCVLGYAHFTGGVDGHGELLVNGECPVRPVIDLGDGWWWVE